MKKTAEQIKAQNDSDILGCERIQEADRRIEEAAPNLLSAAKAAYADVLATKNAALEAELAKARDAATAAPKVARTPVQIGAGAPAQSGCARERWEAGLSTEIAKGKSKSEAVGIVARANPELHEEYLTEINGGRSPADFKCRLKVR